MTVKKKIQLENWQKTKDISQSEIKQIKILVAIMLIQMKIMLCRCIPTRTAEIKNNDNTKCWPGFGEAGSLICCW